MLLPHLVQLSLHYQDHTKELMIGQGEQIGNLYNLDALMVKAIPFSFPICSSVIVDSIVWNNKLGHPSVSKIDNITDVLRIKQRNKRPFHCTICPLAKQKRLSFPSKNNMCASAFDLIHIDVWGPFST